MNNENFTEEFRKPEGADGRMVWQAPILEVRRVEETGNTAEGSGVDMTYIAS